ncbi:MAG: Imidazoleglycerol-phosphate dehydratase [uncultured Thermomicrobiales bacterium]|uniref:Imidazoleglycerol-phosphate dehydratase n=1 Tax=uncultured Thermomicrobiales bacterium TaxID=1645740 RepID=A0A6J4UFD5_9BACT|nr:MAG: Imidazoleglycerol-phosphate dehydratase [uncultured Thermomicrobiales bacterium]
MTGSEPRQGTVSRQTGETQVELTLIVDGRGQAEATTGVGALDHFLTLFARHGLFDLRVQARGDLEIDEHHTVEDVGICLGQALGQALGERRGIRRTAHAMVPMDEALVTVAVDIGGRSYCVLNGAFTGPMVGGLSTELLWHFFDSISREARMNIHILLHYGRNTHHEVEAIFKAFARALDAATTLDPRLGDTLPTTKGRIEGASGEQGQ